MTWEDLDWQILESLRRRFLAGAPGGSYWTSPADLDNYDFTFAQRIGWKWDAVLRELTMRGWQPPAGPVLDWGCGSGIAARCVVGHFGVPAFESLHFDDRAPMAIEFATRAANKSFPALPVSGGVPGSFATLLVSHVLNELDAAGREQLLKLCGQAQAILWVEPGTREDSGALVAVREELLSSGFAAVAPCTHSARCGMLNAHNARHWCHHFAAPPDGVRGNRYWAEFGRAAGIDLRSIPYSFLVLERRAPDAANGWTRVIGRPRVYKGYAKILDCSREDVVEVRAQERDQRELFRAMKKGDYPTLVRGHPLEKGWMKIDEAR